MISVNQIKAKMPIICSDGANFAVVDHMEGEDVIKLKKDENGHHHFIPLAWVTSIEGDGIKIDRSLAQAMRERSSTPP